MNRPDKGSVAFVTDSSETGKPSLATHRRGWAILKSLLRWVVAGLILWLLFREVPFQDAVTAAQRADLWILVPAAFGVVLVRFWLDATTLAWLITRFHTPLSGKEARSLYALVNVVHLINWALGVAAMLARLKRSKGLSLVDSTSTTYFCAILDGTLKVGIGLGGIAVLVTDPLLRPIAAAVLLLLLGHLLTLWFLMSGHPDVAWARRLRGWRILRTATRAEGRDLGRLLPLRALNVAAFVVFVWIGLEAFSVHVPLAFFLASMPVVMIVGTLPVTPAGLGTQQAAMLYFYRSYGDEAAILAFGVLFPLLFMASHLVILTRYLRPAGARAGPMPAVPATGHGPVGRQRPPGRDDRVGRGA